MNRISREHARAIAVAATRLDRRPAQPATKQDVLATLRHLHIIQIDTIHVVARAPYFVLWSRLGDYDPAWFDALQFPDGLMFEYWAHAASFLPIELWPLLRPAMQSYIKESWARAEGWVAANQALLTAVEDEVRTRGPLRSTDFSDETHTGGGWWNRKPAKQALDVLWSMGRLMIQRRTAFQRVYELTERVLPDWDDAQMPDLATARAELTMRGLQALGFGKARHVADYFRQKTVPVRAQLEAWVAEGRVLSLEVEGWDEPAYAHPDVRPWLEDGAPPSTLTTLLTPFDNLVWDRERDMALWDFDYRIECYTPAAKRRYGYFTLPILRHSALIGRVDAKADRKPGVFRVFALHLEPGVAIDEALLADLAATLRECAAWHRTPVVVIERCDPPQLLKPLQALLA